MLEAKPILDEARSVMHSMGASLSGTGSVSESLKAFEDLLHHVGQEVKSAVNDMLTAFSPFGNGGSSPGPSAAEGGPEPGHQHWGYDQQRPNWAPPQQPFEQASGAGAGFNGAHSGPESSDGPEHKSNGSWQQYEDAFPGSSTGSGNAQPGTDSTGGPEHAQEVPPTESAPSDPVIPDYGGLYAKLGLDNSATDPEIKSAYKTMRFSMHPDKAANAADIPVADRNSSNPAYQALTNKFAEMQNAYDVLGDPSSKVQYDAENIEKHFSQPGME